MATIRIQPSQCTRSSASHSSGYALYEAERHKALRREAPVDAPMAWLTDFCAGENLLPADAAAAAILTRAEPIQEALFNFVDHKAEDPEAYRSFIQDPIERHVIIFEEVD